MGDPLCCVSLDDIESKISRGGPVPLTRIKTLVSMTTPKDFRSHGSCTLPPFVEFDMSAEGFACLYLPSVAPQSATPPTVVSADNNVLGGIGSGTYFNLSKIIVVNKCYNSVKINILQAIDYFLRKLD